MKLSVVILSFRVPYYLLQCLQSVERAITSLDAEIIVVDNCSEDQSCDLVKQYFPEVILVEHKRNDGFSKGNNIGIAKAKGEYICLLNPDTMVRETTFLNSLAFAEQQPKLGALGVKMIDGGGRFLPESKRNFLSMKVAFQKILGYGKGYYASHLDKNEAGQVAVLAGAFMLMKKDRYNEIGGLDEDYFMYGEDIDLSFRFQKAGCQNFYLGEEVILHYKGESTLKDAVYAKRFYEAMRLYYKKNVTTQRLPLFAVNTGLKFIQKLHTIGFSFKVKKESLTQSFLVTERICPAENTLKKCFPSIETISIQKLEEEKPSSTLLIFDSACYTFDQQIAAMEKFSGNGNRFRMFSELFSVIVGSDDSASQGEVIHLCPL